MCLPLLAAIPIAAGIAGAGATAAGTAGLVTAGVAGAIAAGSAVVGTGAMVAGGVVQANAQSEAASQTEKQALLAEQQAIDNQKLANRSAADVLRIGGVEAGRVRTQASQVVGEQRAAYASSGVDVDSGTAMDVQIAARMIGELDANTIRNNAAREAWGIKTQGRQMRKQGEQARKQGYLQAQAYRDQATGTILTTGGSALRSGVDFYKTGSGVDFYKTGREAGWSQPSDSTRSF